MPVVLAVAYTYEPDYRLTDGVADDGIATVQELGLSHDLAGNITAIVDRADDLVAIDMGRRAAAAGPTAKKGMISLRHRWYTTHAPLVGQGRGSETVVRGLCPRSGPGALSRPDRQGRRRRTASARTPAAAPSA